MIKAIIFDCFGVVATDALRLACDELARSDAARADEIRRLTADCHRGLIGPDETHQKIAGLLGLDLASYQLKIAGGEVKHQSLLDWIAGLKKTYKTGLLSNVSQGGLSNYFSAGELARYFDAAVASGDIGYAKPEAQAYEIMADRLGVLLSECVFTDDREEYC
ncbi:MAG: HAD family hydrolase, partial [Candidatus Saccharimonadales bacterium]